MAAKAFFARWGGLLQGGIALIAMMSATGAFGQDAEEEAPQAEDVPLEEAPQTDGQDPEMPRSMSGMSILGNEEAPKSLVIIPWKSSQLGDDIDLEDSLDDQAKSCMTSPMTRVVCGTLPKILQPGGSKWIWQRG